MVDRPYHVVKVFKKRKFKKICCESTLFEIFRVILLGLLSLPVDCSWPLRYRMIHSYFYLPINASLMADVARSVICRTRQPDWPPNHILNVLKRIIFKKFFSKNGPFCSFSLFLCVLNIRYNFYAKPRVSLNAPSETFLSVARGWLLQQINVIKWPSRIRCWDSNRQRYNIFGGIYNCFAAFLCRF